MRSHFDEQLALLNKELIEMGALCEEVIELASNALENGDTKLAAKIAPLDAQIDEKERTLSFIGEVPIVHLNVAIIRTKESNKEHHQHKNRTINLFKHEELKNT